MEIIRNVHTRYHFCQSFPLHYFQYKHRPVSANSDRYNRPIPYHFSICYIAVVICINAFGLQPNQPRNTGNHLGRTAGNGDPMHEEWYHTQDTSRMGTARVKQEEEADTRIMVMEQCDIQKKGTWARREKVPKQGLTNARIYLWSSPRDASLPTTDQTK